MTLFNLILFVSKPLFSFVLRARAHARTQSLLHRVVLCRQLHNSYHVSGAFVTYQFLRLLCTPASSFEDWHLQINRSLYGVVHSTMKEPSRCLLSFLHTHVGQKQKHFILTQEQQQSGAFLPNLPFDVHNDQTIDTDLYTSSFTLLSDTSLSLENFQISSPSSLQSCCSSTFDTTLLLPSLSPWCALPSDHHSVPPCKPSTVVVAPPGI